MRTRLLSALSALPFVAGCGGSSQPDRAAIQTALAQSPYSYFHYRSPIWSGARLRPRLETVNAGGCAGPQPTDEGGAVSGPISTQQPTPAERRAIVTAARHPPDRCATYSVAISKLDSRYATVRARFHKPYRNCNLYNGVDIVERTSRGWREVSEASEPFPCDYAPAGAVRSLFGMCLTVK